MKTLKYTLILLLFACTTKKLSFAPSSFSEEQRVAVYEGVLEHQPYEHMFQQTQNPLYLEGQSFGQLTAGFKGLILYSGFSQSLRDLVNKEVELPDDDDDDFYSLRMFEFASKGIPVFAGEDSYFVPWGEKGTLEEPFHHYNKSIIAWGMENFMVEPSTMIHGVEAREIYHKTLKRFFRVLTESYLEVENNLQWYEESMTYRDTMVTAGFEGLDYLDKRYANRLEHYKSSYGHSVFTGPMAIGFWLRRDIDGTRDEIWKALSMVMNTYDKDWYNDKK